MPLCRWLHLVVQPYGEGEWEWCTYFSLVVPNALGANPARGVCYCPSSVSGVFFVCKWLWFLGFVFVLLTLGSIHARNVLSHAHFSHPSIVSIF